MNDQVELQMGADAAGRLDLACTTVTFRVPVAWKQQVLLANQKFIVDRATLAQFGGIGNNKVLYKEHAGSLASTFKKLDPAGIADCGNLFVYRSGGIGDLLFTYPVLAAIKRAHPGCRISFLAQSHYHDFLHSFEGGLVDETLSLPLDFKTFQRADAHLIYQGLIERHPNAKSVDAYDLFFQEAFPGQTVDASLLPRFIPDPGLRRELEPAIPPGMILIHARSNSPFRNVSKQIWLDLIPSLVEAGYPVGMIDGSEAASSLDRFIHHNFPGHANRILNLAALSTSLQHSIEICGLASYAIGVDSSIINLFALTGKPCIGLYTCFPGRLRLSHFKQAQVVQSSYTDCGKMPCFHHLDGRVRCADVERGLAAGCPSGFDPAALLELALRQFVA